MNFAFTGRNYLKHIYECNTKEIVLTKGTNMSTEKFLVAFTEDGDDIIIESCGQLVKDDIENNGRHLIDLGIETPMDIDSVLLVWEGRPVFIRDTSLFEVSYADGTWRALTAEEWEKVKKGEFIFSAEEDLENI